MAQRITPNSVKIISQDGEVQVAISLELTINLNANGLNVTAQASEPEKVKEIKAKDYEWAIPDFGESPKVNFGKLE